MLLTIDIGNTNVTLGLYEGAKLGARWRLATDHNRMADEYGLQILGLLQHSGCSPRQLNGISFASVVPQITSRVLQACQQYLHQDAFVIDHEVKTGIKILYDDPKAVGADRIVDAVAALTLYGGPVCIVDFGTATTFNGVTASGEYLGGAIFPGLGIALDALVSRTSKLYRVEMRKPPAVIGRNTTHALQSGLIFGYVSMVEGMINRFRQELGEDMKAVATGGLSEIIAPETKALHFTNPWLTLEGLRILWDMNH